MGTRADFYIGRGENAEWIGSIAYDGYPEAIPAVIFSATTDYAYALDDGKVWASGFGGGWFDPLKPDSDTEENHSAKSAIFPDMSALMKTTFGKRSGLLIIGGPS